MQKYTLHISCNGQSRKLVMARATEESERHLAMKLLAYLLYFDCEPTIELSVGQHYKPDLAIVDGRDVTLWVDCGVVSPHKLDRITTSNRQAEIVVVKPDCRSARACRSVVDRRVRRPERVEIITFDDGFIDQITHALSTRSTVVASVGGEPRHVDVKLNGTAVGSSVHSA